MTNFPTSLDTLISPTVGQPRNLLGVEDYTTVTNLNNAVMALETKVGANGSADTSSLDYKVAQVNPLTTKGDIIVRSATANTRLPVGTDGQMLVADSTQALGVKYTNPTSGGTVTTTSVVSANGFTGSVANPTTTPAITLTTSVTGLLKGNGTAISAATAGTDYVAPGGTDIPVSDGGTGVSAFNAYGTIIGGTTTTGPLQSASPGTAGFVLTSNGPTSAPTMQALSIAQYVRNPVTISSSCSGIGGNNTSSSIYIDRPITLYYTIGNIYGSLAYTNADIDWSLDGSTGWTNLVTVGDQKTFTGITEVTNGVISVNKVYLRVKTVSGNSTSASITLKG